MTKIRILFLFIVYMSKTSADDSEIILSPPTIQVLPTKGELGSQLINYIKAKRIAYNSNIPLIIHSNDCFQQFLISKKEIYLEGSLYNQNKLKCKKIVTRKDVSLKNDKKAHYCVHQSTHLTENNLLEYKQDEKFIKELKRYIAPLKPITLIQPHSDRISIALHIKKETVDIETLQKINKNSFHTIYTKSSKSITPLQFYIDQIKNLSKYFDHQNLYVYLFTDFEDPKWLITILKDLTRLNNILFDSREKDTLPSEIEIEDFFSMMEFDYLIRPYNSKFSLIAEFLGNNKIVISPKACQFVGKENIFAQTLSEAKIHDYTLPSNLLSKNSNYLLKEMFNSEEYFHEHATIQFIPGGGRLGDQLLEYVKAKWISYQNDIPLLLPPMNIFKGLNLYEIDQVKYLPSYDNILSINQTDVFLNKKSPHHYQISYFPILNYEEIKKLKNNTAFISELKKLISPSISLSLFEPKKDKISIAVHVRKEHNHGSAKTLKSVQIFDLEHISTCPFTNTQKTHMDLDFPNKFPPEQFYIDQIKYLSECFEHQPLYIFIFTDDENPKSLTERIQKHVNLENIEYDYRKSDSTGSIAVLEDFFSMMHFDCLIRPLASNFSLIAELLGNHKLVIAQDTFHWEKDTDNNYYLIVDNVTIQQYHSENRYLGSEN